jgi:hypothetical protein
MSLSCQYSTPIVRPAGGGGGHKHTGGVSDIQPAERLTAQQICLKLVHCNRYQWVATG